MTCLLNMEQNIESPLLITYYNTQSLSDTLQQNRAQEEELYLGTQIMLDERGRLGGGQLGSRCVRGKLVECSLCVIGSGTHIFLHHLKHQQTLDQEQRMTLMLRSGF